MDRFADILDSTSSAQTGGSGGGSATGSVIDLDELNLWVEVDKGLSAENIGQQCEAILKLTDLIDRFPLPVFVNSGFLRLAKVFQNGNNYLKLQVIRVIEKNQKHLVKILNLDETIRLIFYNIHSNDCLCRALTLRALAEIATVISERHQVQHSIRLALESHDEIEAKEAVYAADKFCNLSKAFAASLFDRIVELIEDVQSPLDRKLRLIPLLCHMHYDTSLSVKTKELLEAMYHSFPRADVSKIVLKTLTKMSCKSLTNIHETVRFYMKLLHQESRQRLQLFLLDNLHELAHSQSAHLWTSENIHSLVDFTLNLYNTHASQSLLVRSSQILCSLAKQNSNVYFLVEFGDKNDTKLLDLIERVINDQDSLDTCYNFCMLSTNLLLIHHTESNELARLFEITERGLFKLIRKLDQETTKIELLQKTLRRALDLTETNSEAYFNRLLVLLLCLVENIDNNNEKGSGKRFELYCDTLLALYSSQTHLDHLEQLSLIQQIYKRLAHTDRNDIKIKLFNILFELQVRRVDYLLIDDDEQPHHLSDNVERLINGSGPHNYWFVFKLARMCSRYSHHDLAQQLYTLLAQQFNETTGGQDNSVYFKSWLEFMSTVSEAECSLYQCKYSTMNVNITDLVSRLNQALLKYSQALSLFKALCCQQLVSTPTGSSQSNHMENASGLFQVRYCELRIEQIRLYLSLMLGLMTYETIPVPVFQLKVNGATEKSVNKLTTGCRLSQQMKHSVNELNKLNQKYKELLSECFDADHHTLNILNVCKKNNECLIFLIGQLTSPKNGQKAHAEFVANFMNSKANTSGQITSEVKLSENFYSLLLENLNDMEASSTEKLRVKHFQNILIEFIGFPLPVPRSFFTTIQKTQIKLMVSPKDKKNLRTDQTLVVKIDGIISQQTRLHTPFRSVKKVQITLTTELDPKSVTDVTVNMNRVPKYVDVKSSIEEPRNDYFNANMLIGFPWPGVYTVLVDLYLMDNSDTVWHHVSSTESKHQLQVKVDEDAAQRQNKLMMYNILPTTSVSH